MQTVQEIIEDAVTSTKDIEAAVSYLATRLYVSQKSCVAMAKKIERMEIAIRSAIEFSDLGVPIHPASELFSQLRISLTD